MRFKTLFYNFLFFIISRLVIEPNFDRSINNGTVIINIQRDLSYSQKLLPIILDINQIEILTSQGNFKATIHSPTRIQSTNFFLFSPRLRRPGHRVRRLLRPQQPVVPLPHQGTRRGRKSPQSNPAAGVRKPPQRHAAGLLQGFLPGGRFHRGQKLVREHAIFANRRPPCVPLLRQSGHEGDLRNFVGPSGG